MLRRARIAVIGFFTLSALFATFAIAADPPAAVVAALDGPATTIDAGGKSHEVHAFDWLNPETTIETGPGGHVTLAFSNGRRYDMRENARLTVVAAGATNLSGPVRPLSPMPPMPKLPAVAPGSGASGQSGAVRVRSITAVTACRYPRDGYTVQASRASLRIKTPATFLRVEILDDSGAVVYKTDASFADVPVPAGMLRPGAQYSWRVRSADTIPTTLDHAEFTTLSDENTTARAAFMAGFPARDPDTLALFAEVDQRLGLLLEARDELREAAAHAPHSPHIDVLLRDIELAAGGN